MQLGMLHCLRSFAIVGIGWTGASIVGEISEGALALDLLGVAVGTVV